MSELPITTPCECPAHGKDYPVYTKGGLRIIDTCAIRKRQSMSQLSVVDTVMISGHFAPFHDGHLSYIKQASKLGTFLLCVISSDAQLLKKKGRVNIPEAGRREIVDLILSGLSIPHTTVINIWDTKTTLVAEALRKLEPNIFFRGPDKTPETMPLEESQACEELGIEVRYATMEYDRHGVGMQWL